MKPLARLALGVVALAGSASFVASAQSVISAKSGVVHYAEGSVYLGDQLIESKFGSFPDIKENAQFRTEEGRAEVLLTPGVFLRMAESSGIRMITNRLIDTRVEFLSGSILVEAADLLKDNAVTVVYKDYIIQLTKKGLYRFDSEPAALRVYDGVANAQLNGTTEEVKEGHVLALNGELKQAKFDKDDTDSLYRWSRRRSEYLAMANVSAAKSVRDNGSYSLMNGSFTNGWYFNPYFNMYTFIPYRGVMYSPFGFAFWSPYSVYGYLDAYSYAPYYNRPSRGIGSSATGSTLASSRLSTTVARATGAGSTRSVSSPSSGGFGHSGSSARSVSTAASSPISSGISRGDGGAGRAGGHGK